LSFWTFLHCLESDVPFYASHFMWLGLLRKHKSGPWFWWWTWGSVEGERQIGLNILDFYLYKLFHVLKICFSNLRWILLSPHNLQIFFYPKYQHLLLVEGRFSRKCLWAEKLILNPKEAYERKKMKRLFEYSQIHWKHDDFKEKSFKSQSKSSFITWPIWGAIKLQRLEGTKFLILQMLFKKLLNILIFPWRNWITFLGFLKVFVSIRSLNSKTQKLFLGFTIDKF